MAMSFKKAVNRIHLVLGLLSGLIVFIVSMTGACWVLQEEITDLTEAELTVEPRAAPFITPLRAREIALEVYPSRTIHGTAYGHSDEAVEVIFYEAEPEEFYHSVLLHPQTGEVLRTKDHRAGFFWFVLRGHLYLWLPPTIGAQLTRYGTMIFVLMLFTGIALWWPKRRRQLRQRLRFDWRATTGWRRKNFDLHSVLGFYVSVLALLIAFSGLIMAFDWVYFVTYKAWGGDKDPRFVIPDSRPPDGDERAAATLPAIETIVPRLVRENPDYHQLEVHYPATDTASIYVEVSRQRGVYYNSDYRFFDRHSGEELDAGSIYGTYAEASLADRVLRMNYDIHVGAIGGLPGKMIALLASLLSASLPITGFALWWGRRRKQKPAAARAPTRLSGAEA